MTNKTPLHLPVESVYILYKLHQANFQGYLVGGAVRDLLLNSFDNTSTGSPTVTDYDFTTNAIPEQIQQIFPNSFYENKFGTVSISYQHLVEQMNDEGFVLSEKNIKNQLNQSQEKSTDSKIIDIARATKIHSSLDSTENSLKSKSQLEPPAFEITTYRSDGQYLDGRRPESVSWGKQIEEDLNRRDFTINAMAIGLKQDFLEKLFNQHLGQVDPLVLDDQYLLVDLHGGLSDLQHKIIRTVGEPNQRFHEDALRMLRAIRMAVQLEMQIDPSSYQAILTNSQLITKVSQERIADELLKMLSSNWPKQAIELLDKTGLLPLILPELIATKGVEQAGHHTTDVWQHSLDSLQNCPSKDPIVRLATLLHDIAKPNTQQFQNDTISFYNHEILGSRIASNVGKRLRLSKNDLQRLFLLVRYHMFHYQPENSDASIRRLMRKVGLENIDDILALREGDRLGSGAAKTSWRLEELKERMIEQLHQPMDVTDLAIDGHMLMAELGLKPGPILGKLLNQLFEIVLEKPEANQRHTLLEMAKTLLKQEDHTG